MDNMLFGCFNFISKSVDTLMVHLKFVGIMWILSDCLNVMLYKECDRNNQILISNCCVYINKYWIVNIRWKQLL